MNDDLISKQELLKKLNELDQQALYLPCHFKDFIVDQVPSFQRKNGQWVKYPDCYGCFKCSECGMLSLNRLRYCCGCGAKMEERWSK